MKKFTMMNAFRISDQSYSDLTEILLYNIEYDDKSDEKTPRRNFVHQ